MGNGNTHFIGQSRCHVGLVYNAGDFPEYDQFTKEMERLPKALFNAKEAFDPLAGDYASRYGMEPLTYVLGREICGTTPTAMPCALWRNVSGSGQNP